MSLKLQAIRFNQKNIPMYIAIVSPGILDHFSIDTWDPKNVVKRRGYQRSTDEQRVKKIAKYFEYQDSIMPVAGLLNVREKGKLSYKHGELTIPDSSRVWVVDMQHRLKGIVTAHQNGLLRGQFYFPVVITEGLSQLDEAAQFYLINTKSKKMDVALTRRLLIENNKVRDIADVKPWEIQAVHITIDLNESKSLNNNPWNGAIREPNQEKLQLHIATEKSFVSSLRNLLIRGRNKQPHKIAKRLSNFWIAIKENIPEAFAEPRKSLIQKTPGMFAFNYFIAPQILAKCKKDKDLSKRLMGLKKLGANFWLRSNKNGARKFGTGMGGYSNLADYILKHL